MLANEREVTNEQYNSGESSSPGPLAAVVSMDHGLTHTEAG